MFVSFTLNSVRVAFSSTLCLLSRRNLECAFLISRRKKGFMWHIRQKLDAGKACQSMDYQRALVLADSMYHK